MKGGFVKFLKALPDIFLLSLLWLIFSMGIITVGAATCAAYYVALKIVKDEEIHLFKFFLKAFKEDFLQGTLMWLITLPMLAVTGYSWYWFTRADYNTTPLLLLSIALTLIFFFVNLFAYPLIARYSNTFKMVIKNSLGVSLIYFPRTMLTILLVIAEGVFFFILGRYTFAVGILIAPGFIIYTVSAMSKMILWQLEHHQENEAAED
ncbi:MAG: YesL family protein [Treponema sp.]|nr:YesL family protein [Treponema sp.]